MKKYEMLFIAISWAAAIISLGAAFTSCTPSAYVFQGPAGRDGVNGADGRDGQDGVNGTSGYNSLISTVNVAPGCPNGGVTYLVGLDTDRDSVLVLEEITQSVEICHGVNGVDAPVSHFTMTELIDPCGDTPNAYDEVLLRLANGTILASLSGNGSALTTRLAVIPAGTWSTTDGTGCVFSVSNDGVVSW